MGFTQRCHGLLLQDMMRVGCSCGSQVQQGSCRLQHMFPPGASGLLTCNMTHVNTGKGLANQLHDAASGRSCRATSRPPLRNKVERCNHRQEADAVLTSQYRQQGRCTRVSG